MEAGKSALYGQRVKSGLRLAGPSPNVWPLVIKEIEQEMVNGLLPLEGAVNVLANGESRQAAVKQYPLRAALSPESCGHVQKVKLRELE